MKDLAAAANLQYLTKENTEFFKTQGNMLAAKVQGELHPVVYVHCSFPHTGKRSYLSIRNAENKEIGIIQTLDSFPEDIVHLLEEQLQVRYFTPEISKVISIKEEFGYAYWEANTSAGLCRFTVRGGGGNAKLVTPTRLLVTDVDGNRFVIPDINKLTDKEYRMVEICM